MSTLAVAMILILLAPAASAGAASSVLRIDQTASPSPADQDERLREADRLRDSGQLEAALATYKVVLDRSPGAAKAHLGAGTALLDLGRPEGAIPFLQEAVRFDPGEHRAWENLGLAHSAVYDRIASELREASFTFRTHPPGADDPRQKRQDELSEKLGERDWPEEAIRCLREAVRLMPEEPKYWHQLGKALKQYHADDLTEMAEALSKAAELDPSHYESQRNLVLALDRAGRHREAWEVCLRLERIARSDDSWLAKEMGDLALELADLEESERRYLRALELDPELAFAHVGLARLHMRRGDLDRSRQHEEAAIQRRPDLEASIRRAVEQER